MRQTLPRFFACFLLLLVSAAGPAAALAAPQIEKVTTAAGIEVWLVREPAIPILALQAAWRGGSASDPAGQEGLASLTADLLTEGAGDLAADAFQNALRDQAVSLAFGADRDYVTVDLKTLTANRARAFELLKLALTAPRFDAEPVARVKAQALVSWQRGRSNPNTLAGERFVQLAWGDHAYGRRSSPSADSLPQITAEAMAAYARGVLARDNLVIGAVGNIEPGELAALVDASFGQLPARAAVALPPMVVPQTAAAPVVIDYPNPQSQVLFGGPGIPRDDPDWYAASVLNQILGGGGMSSRLFEELREKRGLVYGIGVQLSPRKAGALFAGSFATANAQVGEALALVRGEFARIAKDGVGADELADAKAYMTGSFPLRLTSNSAIAGMLVAMRISDLPPDYIQAYPGLINAVTRDDVQRVARRLFGDGRLLVVVVGQPAGLGG
ncbi:pitrilysin family protein [Ferrovibrio sp.]|uniref:M16 family metallopeptidase n=1 Tax=Ferrovibrio sp. TaxID=1917215 RepID=UPI00311DF71F